jgi:hypothetical protein
VGRGSAAGCVVGDRGATMTRALSRGNPTTTASGSATSALCGPRPRPDCLWLSLPCRWPSKPSNRCCRCSEAGARAGMSSTTSWACHRSRAGGVAVSRSSGPDQELKHSGRPGGPHSRGRRQAFGDLLRHDRQRDGEVQDFRPSRAGNLLAYLLTCPVVVGGLTLGRHIDRTKG